MNTYIAIDIGASSGRLMKSQYIDGQLSLEEVHRFKNEFRPQAGHDRWQIEALIEEILLGLQKVKQAGIETCYVGIDTWAVDYCLIDANGTRLADPIAYRDARTADVLTKFTEKMSLQTVYEKTGIQLQPFNTLFQLFVEPAHLLAQANKLLLIPDYLGYVFTGKMVTEKTNASTMQLLNVMTQTWDKELLEILGLSSTIFPELVEPGKILGELLVEKFPQFDLPQATFITVASHDTASAIIGTPATDAEANWGYISSGTWSLLGTESQQPNVSPRAFQENYTNEWGAQQTIRFLKNIMGMWLIQEVAREQNYQYSYAELADLAAQAPAFQQFINVNDPRFLNPASMIQEIQQYCKETQQPVPQTAGEIARSIYDNLALCYALELQKLEQLTDTNQPIEQLYIVGGGSNNRFLNQLTANVANKTIIAGPSEATAIGNLVMQMVATGEVASIQAGRQAVKESFANQHHEPEPLKTQLLTDYQLFLAKERI